MLQVFIEILSDVVESIYQNGIQENVLSNGRRMASAITVMCCFHKIIPKVLKFDDILPATIVQLVSMLRLMPDVQNELCEDWSHLKLLINPAFQKVICEAVQGFIMHISHTQHFSQRGWMFAIPLLHFLHDVSQPFQQDELDPRKIPWKDSIIGFSGIRSTTHDLEIE